MQSEITGPGPLENPIGALLGCAASVTGFTHCHSVRLVTGSCSSPSSYGEQSDTSSGRGAPMLVARPNLLCGLRIAEFTGVGRSAYENNITFRK